jgi:hypothetical protein
MFLDLSSLRNFPLEKSPHQRRLFLLEASHPFENCHFLINRQFLYRLFPNGTFEIITLRPGKYDYSLNNKIDVSHVRTIKNGLCYKLEFENPVSFFQIIVMSSLQETNKLTKVNLIVAAKNTWQGIILNDWPYNQVPLKIGKEIVSEHQTIYDIKLKEELWKNLEGYDEFDDCMNELDSLQGCISMFEPQTRHNENRYK